MMTKRKHKSLEQVAKEEEDITIEETRTIKCELPMGAYRTLTKLAADQVPFVKVSQYSCNVLVEHAAGPKKSKRFSDD